MTSFDLPENALADLLEQCAPQLAFTELERSFLETLAQATVDVCKQEQAIALPYLLSEDFIISPRFSFLVRQYCANTIFA
jgi:hypothetical protein